MNSQWVSRLKAHKNKLARRVRSAANYLLISPIARRVWRENLTYLSPTKLKQLETECRRIQEQKISGDFAEFGIALGGSAILLASRAKHVRAFHGFDVFGMIPQPTSARDGAKSRERYDIIASGRSTGIGGAEYYGYRHGLYQQVTESFRQFGVPADNASVQLHKGLFEDTWRDAERQISCLALVHIDCDWYEPVRFCLENSNPRLTIGGAMIVDDYFAYPGAREATDEFLGRHGNYEVTCRELHLILRKTA